MAPIFDQHTRTKTLRQTGHFLLLTCALFEVVELEIVRAGTLHHILDAVLIAGYAVAVALLSMNWRVALGAAVLGTMPWLIDYSAWQGPTDVEGYLWSIFHLYLAGWLGSRFSQKFEVTYHHILDLLSIYILVALVFADIYSAIQHQSPGALVRSGYFQNGKVTLDLVIYYSFATQLTVGYGDIIAGNSEIRTLSILQSLFGVLFPTVTIARYVSLQLNRVLEFERQSRSDSRPPDQY